ncbi:unnamed protein product [Rotaria sordida]|uniref:Uncharacterized protein n=1 Tax=Rotaria sordida TaxID=392033 RepID=A0A815EXY5_9BILA|nr:unnamed protein product [Rotaria sordida]
MSSRIQLKNAIVYDNVNSGIRCVTVINSLSGVTNGIILSPDALTSSACTSTLNFHNAITCPSLLDTWIRSAFNKTNLEQNGEVLNVYDTSNRHTVVLYLHKRFTHSNIYMMNLLAGQTYLCQFQNTNSSINIFYLGVAYDLAPGNYLIIRHNVNYMPDRYNDYQEERTGYQLKRKAGFHLSGVERGRHNFTSESLSFMRPVYKKAVEKIIEDEENRDPTSSTTVENDDDNQYYGEPVPELATANDNTNSYPCVRMRSHCDPSNNLQDNTEIIVNVDADNNGNVDRISDSSPRLNRAISDQ